MTLNDILDRTVASVARALLWLFRRMDVVQASNLGGWLARSIGPMLPVTKVGDANLRLAMPELDAASRKRVLREVWDNLGRTVAEFPHLGELGVSDAGPGWVMEGEENLRALRDSPAPALLVGAHLSNWEILPVVGARYGLRFGVFYRAASNKEVDRLIQELREQAAHRKMPSFAKGAQGARQAVAHLTKGGHLGLLFDQKLNNGISVKLFGHDAMTAPAAAAFALRYKAALVAAHIQRIGTARYRVVIEKPLPHPDTGSNEGDVAALTLALNQRLEAWVRHDPGQWLWLHRRWPKEATRTS
jgi:KDO2-lipid IV(A) lauroyltransferase